VKKTKSNVRYNLDNLPFKQFAFSGQSHTLYCSLKCSPTPHCIFTGTPWLHLKKLLQSASFFSRTVYSIGSVSGHVTRGSSRALTSSTKHARRAGNISDAGEKPEMCNTRKITTKLKSLLASITLSFCYTVILLHCHFITLSFCYTVILLHCHFITLSFYYTVILLHYHFVTLSFCYTVLLLHCPSLS
jgi:hypothetical protein